jgi:N-acetylmuramoyl-L-alanine amidase
VVTLFAAGVVAVLAARVGGSTAPESSGAGGATSTPLVAEPGTTTFSGSKANESATTSTAALTVPEAVGAKGLSGKTIAIDAGHNGGNYLHTSEINRLVDAGTVRKPCDTTGTETNSGYTEAAYTLDVALRLRTILQKRGARVVMTRTSNDGWGPCITERATIGNRAHADAAISIHADGGPAAGRGFHVIYPRSIAGLTAPIAPRSKRLALAVRAAFARGTPMPYANYIGRSGLDERSDLGGLNLSTVPKVLIETGNMRNATDAALLGSPSFHEREAAALAAGLASYLAH